MQIVIDWDGTVTVQDTLLLTLRHFISPAVLVPLERELDVALAQGTLTHREVMEREFVLLTASQAAVVNFLVANARIRPGFSDFVKLHNPLILSSGFHETIEPILCRERVTARLRANRVDPRPDGWRINWTSDSDCAICGQPCKRGSLPNEPFVYIGDGYSDRCASLAADRIFARDDLARYLETQAVAFEPFADFNDVAAALKKARPSGRITHRQ